MLYMVFWLLLIASPAFGDNYIAEVLPWVNGMICYVKSGSFSVEEWQVVINAMAEIERHTCVVFRPQTVTTEHCFRIDKPSGSKYTDTSCSTFIVGRGNLTSDPKTLELLIPMTLTYTLSCRKYVGLLVQKLMQIIGFVYETTRPDRSRHVSVVGHQIQNWETYNVWLRRQFPDEYYEQYGTPYDLSSIMHPGSSTEAGYLELQMSSEPENWEGFGRLLGLTKVDIYRLNKLFGCVNFNYSVIPEANQIVYFRCNNIILHSDDWRYCTDYEDMMLYIRSNSYAACQDRSSRRYKYCQRIKDGKSPCANRDMNMRCSRACEKCEKETF